LAGAGSVMACGAKSLSLAKWWIFPLLRPNMLIITLIAEAAAR
jgi:hypothetical protein